MPPKKLYIPPKDFSPRPTTKRYRRYRPPPKSQSWLTQDESDLEIEQQREADPDLEFWYRENLSFNPVLPFESTPLSVPASPVEIDVPVNDVSPETNRSEKIKNQHYTKPKRKSSKTNTQNRLPKRSETKPNKRNSVHENDSVASATESNSDLCNHLRFICNKSCYSGLRPQHRVSYVHQLYPPPEPILPKLRKTPQKNSLTGDNRPSKTSSWKTLQSAKNNNITKKRTIFDSSNSSDEASKSMSNTQLFLAKSSTSSTHENTANASSKINHVLSDDSNESETFINEPQENSKTFLIEDTIKIDVSTQTKQLCMQCLLCTCGPPDWRFPEVPLGKYTCKYAKHPSKFNL